MILKDIKNSLPPGCVEFHEKELVLGEYLIEISISKYEDSILFLNFFFSENIMDSVDSCDD